MAMMIGALPQVSLALSSHAFFHALSISFRRLRVWPEACRDEEASQTHRLQPVRRLFLFSAFEQVSSRSHWRSDRLEHTVPTYCLAPVSQGRPYFTVKKPQVVGI